MNDLADFLLARIDEQEQALDSCQDWSECDPSYGCPAHPATGDRRNELDSIRQIIDGLRQTAVSSTSPWDGCGDDCEFKEAWWVLGHLAAPYASHPDYQQEWKP